MRFVALALLLCTPAVALAEEPAPSPTPALLPPILPIDPRLEAPGAIPAQGGSLLLGGGLFAPAPPPPPRLTHARVAAMVAVPAGCVAIGGATWAGLTNQTGDAGTPAVEMGAGYAGSWAATAVLAVGVYSVDRNAFIPVGNRGGFKDATWTVIGSAVAVPLAAGGATFMAGERLEGRSPHPNEALGAAMGGAALGELLSSGSALLFHTPAVSGPIALAFVPVGAGSALGYRLARGTFGREKPLLHAPLVVVSGRF